MQKNLLAKNLIFHVETPPESAPLPILTLWLTIPSKRVAAAVSTHAHLVIGAIRFAFGATTGTAAALATHLALGALRAGVFRSGAALVIEEAALA